jgi:hypothetical protein
MNSLQPEIPTLDHEGRLHLPILGSRSPAKMGFGGIKWGVAPLDTPNDPPLVGDNRVDAIALLDYDRI